MAIACAYCGGQHAAPSDVRACWQRSQDSGQTVAEPDPDRSVADRAVPGAPRSTALVLAFEEPGPNELARSIVVNAGRPAPTAWVDAERVVIDGGVIADPVGTVAVLQDHARSGRRVVVEIAPDVAGRLDEPPRSIETAAPYALGPRFCVPLDVKPKYRPKSVLRPVPARGVAPS